MSRLARTPENFPKMKHRAAGRLTRRKVEKIFHAADVLRRASKAIGEVFGGIMDAFRRVTETLNAMPTQADFALVPPPVVHELSPEIRARLERPELQFVPAPLSAEQAAVIMARSHELAVQRGHIRRYP